MIKRQNCQKKKYLRVFKIGQGQATNENHLFKKKKEKEKIGKKKKPY